ncbi:MAG: ribosomal protein S18-alanine N-acetyltransferase [Dehalococcoidia bacterium]
MQTTALRYLVRPMTLGDISQVMEIEQQSFPTMWPQTAFKRELQQNRLARYLVAIKVQDGPPTAAAQPYGPSGAAPLGSSGGFARFLSDLKHVFAGEEPPPPGERSELVVGFIGVWLLPEEAHIVTIAVREDSRGRGVGELLLIAAIGLAQQNQQPLVTLEVRVSNSVAVALYEKYGFKHMGLRPNYYTDNREDAYVLTVDQLSSPEYRELLQRLKREHADRWGESQLQL